MAGWRTGAPKDAPGGAVEVFFRPDEVVFAPLERSGLDEAAPNGAGPNGAGPNGAGMTGEVKAVVQRGPDARVECLIEGRLFELTARGPGLPDGVAPGRAVRVKPLRPQVYPA
ncbi:MAG: hypothetical protein JSS35_10820 [Proteobacteria bacterium]|nr:hypothetical protein [Pseudomonadota bacterium]